MVALQNYGQIFILVCLQYCPRRHSGMEIFITTVTTVSLSLQYFRLCITFLVELPYNQPTVTKILLFLLLSHHILEAHQAHFSLKMNTLRSFIAELLSQMHILLCFPFSVLGFGVGFFTYLNPHFANTKNTSVSFIYTTLHCNLFLFTV